MPGPLSYPPEILIESTVDLPFEFGDQGIKEPWIEVAGLVIEFLIELPFHL